MANVFMSSVTHDGKTLDDGDDNVIVFSRFGAQSIQAAFSQLGFECHECYEVPSKDVQFYIHQAVRLSEQGEARVAEILTDIKRRGVTCE